jgi:ATP-dependent DNA helicase 2 subunit 1
MSSYYGDKSRDIASWESFEAGDDDEALDISEVWLSSSLEAD